MDQKLSQFMNQKYLNLETFRKTGVAVKTPVWFVLAMPDGKFYVRTAGASAKVKRIHNNSQVNIMPCGEAGEPLGDWVPARAREVTDSATADFVRGLLVEKYGDMVAYFEEQTKARGFEYTVLLLEVGD